MTVIKRSDFYFERLHRNLCGFTGRLEADQRGGGEDVSMLTSASQWLNWKTTRAVVADKQRPQLPARKLLRHVTYRQGK